jgi:hypothetical protein
MPPGPRPVPPTPRVPDTRPKFDTAPQWQGERNQYQNQQQNAGTTMLGSNPTDQYNGMTPQEMFDATLAAMSGATQYTGGGGGGGGGGGSRNPANPDPLGWNAIAMSEATKQGYADMLAALDAKNAALSGGYDSRTAALQNANQSSIDRFGAIQQQLQQERNAASQAAAGTFQSGQADLRNIMNQYQQMVAGRQAPAGATLQAFGADPGAAVSDPSGVQNMLVAQQANLARVGQADAALYAGRDNVYAGLNQDVSTQRQQGFDSLMAKLLAEKQATEAAAAAERAQLTMQQQQAMLQLAAQEQARKAQYV